jgi:feruloyl esterase
VEAWIHNAISIFTGPAKSIVHGYYGSPARYSYYDGCSTGGAQGFSLAQFHPDLFDGIYAGSPGNWYSHLALSFLWNAVNTQNESQIPLNTLNAITAAVLDECDTLDGVQDGMLENPLMCKFDINSMSCNSSTANASSCLTDSQLGAAKKIYAGPTSTINGDEIYPGFTIGSEASWFGQEGIIDSLADDFSIPLLQNLVYDSLHYNAVDFNFGSNVADMDSNCGQYIDAITTDLSAFKNHGGKIIVTQGNTITSVYTSIYNVYLRFLIQSTAYNT